MTHPTATEHNIALRDYLEVIGRRKWIVFAAALLVPLAAVALSVAQKPVYEGSAQVLLSRENLANSLTGVTDPNASVEQGVFVQTQADLARVPELASRVIERLGLSGLTPDELLSDSEVVTGADSEILTFKVRSEDPQVAMDATTEYAEQFAEYRRELDTASIAGARAEVADRLEALEAGGDTSGQLYASLAKQEQRLSTMETLQTSGAKVIQTAGEAPQVAPTPVRDGVLGLLVGLVLGLGLAFLREALDTRVRSGEEVGARLHLPLLGRIPAPPKKVRSEERLVTAVEPMGPHAEAFRMLRTNLEFAMLDRDVRAIMVTSALPQEGKSTTSGNLALAFARAGRHVALVDLDLRRPFIARFFDLQSKRGITEVALERVSLERALTSVPILPVPAGEPAAGQPRAATGNGAGGGSGGTLQVLTAGIVPPDPGEFVGSQRLRDVLRRLREQVDLVLIDVPPALQIGDAMTLSTQVDGIVVVANLAKLRRGIVTELHRVLDSTPTEKLGFVLAGAETSSGYGYGYGYGYSSHYSQPPEPDASREVGVAGRSGPGSP